VPVLTGRGAILTHSRHRLRRQITLTALLVTTGLAVSATPPDLVLTARIQSANGQVRLHDVAPGATLNSGDGVRVEVGSPRRAYIYVVAVGASGSAVLLHPFSRRPAEALVQANARVRIPQGSEFLPLDRHSGREVVVAVSARTPIRQLEDLLNIAEETVAQGGDLQRALSTFGDTSVQTFVHAPGVAAPQGIAKAPAALFGGDEGDGTVLGQSGSRIDALLAGQQVPPLAAAQEQPESSALAKLFADSPSASNSPEPTLQPVPARSPQSNKPTASTGTILSGIRELLGSDSSSGKDNDAETPERPRAIEPVPRVRAESQRTPVAVVQASTPAPSTPAPASAGGAAVSSLFLPDPSASNQPAAQTPGRPAPVELTEAASVAAARSAPEPVVQSAPEPKKDEDSGGGFFGRLGSLFGSNDEAPAQPAAPAPAARTYAVPAAAPAASAATPAARLPAAVPVAPQVPVVADSVVPPDPVRQQSTFAAARSSSVPAPTASRAKTGPAVEAPVVPVAAVATGTVLGSSGSVITRLLGETPRVAQPSNSATLATERRRAQDLARAEDAARRTQELALAEDAARRAQDLALAEEAARRAQELALAEDAARRAQDLALAEEAARRAQDLALAEDAARRTQELAQAEEAARQKASRTVAADSTSTSSSGGFFANLFGQSSNESDEASVTAATDPEPVADVVGPASRPGPVVVSPTPAADVVSTRSQSTAATTTSGSASFLSTLFGDSSAPASDSEDAIIAQSDSEGSASTAPVDVGSSVRAVADDSLPTRAVVSKSTATSPKSNPVAGSGQAPSAGQRPAARRTVVTASADENPGDDSIADYDGAQSSGDGDGGFSQLLSFFAPTPPADEAPEPGSEAERVAKEADREERQAVAEESSAGGGLFGQLFGGGSGDDADNTTQSGAAVASQARQPAVSVQRSASAPQVVAPELTDRGPRSLPQIGKGLTPGQRRKNNTVLGESGSRIAQLLGGGEPAAVSDEAQEATASSAVADERIVASTITATADSQVAAIEDGPTLTPREPADVSLVTSSGTLAVNEPLPTVTNVPVAAPVTVVVPSEQAALRAVVPAAPPATGTQTIAVSTAPSSVDVTAAIPDRPAITVKPQPSLGQLGLTPTQAQIELDPFADGRIPRSLVLIVTPRGVGSGVVVDDAGHILTNWHSVNGFERVTVWLKANGSGSPDVSAPHVARLIRGNRSSDLALLELETVPEGLEPMPLALEVSAKRGDVMYLVSHFGSSSWRFAPARFVNVKPRHSWLTGGRFVHKEEVLRTRVASKPASSGGALLNSELQMVGLNAHVAKRSPDVYAVNVDSIRRFLAGELASDPNGG
jgi:hypothetical protein